MDVFPELKVPRVTLQTEAPGLTAEEVEQYITIPIESAMNGTAGHLDPAIMAAPLISTIVDACSLIVYFQIACRLLAI